MHIIGDFGWWWLIPFAIGFWDVAAGPIISGLGSLFGGLFGNKGPSPQEKALMQMQQALIAKKIAFANKAGEMMPMEKILGMGNTALAGLPFGFGSSAKTPAAMAQQEMLMKMLEDAKNAMAQKQATGGGSGGGGGYNIPKMP